MYVAVLTSLCCSVDPARETDLSQYEHIVWYPGNAAVERRKQSLFRCPSTNQGPRRQLALSPDDYHLADDNHPAVE